METVIKYTFILLSTLLFAFTASAETLRLNSGESLEGKILKMDENTLFIESHLTAQELKIDRADLSLIEFDSSARSLARRLGIGLHYRPNGNEENLSIKNWISAVDSAELIVGYSSGTQDTFGFELRYSRVSRLTAPPIFFMEPVQEFFPKTIIAAPFSDFIPAVSFSL